MGLHPAIYGLDGKGGAANGQEIIWGAPTYDQCMTGWEELVHGAMGVVRFNISRMETVFPGGGRILFRSLDDPNNARSKTANGFVMDEAAFCHPSAYSEVILPILSDTGGWALLMSTPHGRNWFWQEWVKAKHSDDAASWSAPTLGVAIEDGQLVRKPHPMENPHFPFAEAQKLFREQPDRVFRQEFLAEFTEETGGVFRRVREAVRQGQVLERAVAGSQYVIGADWGRHEDFTAYIVVDLNRRAVVHVDRMREIEFMLQTQRLQVLFEKFKPVRIVAEKNSFGEPIIEHLQRLGLPVSAFLTTAESKRTAIESLAMAFERGAITVPSDETLLAELEAYQGERLPSGLIRYGAPEGLHDDLVMALAMAWQSVSDVPRSRDLKAAQPSWSRR